MQTFNIAGVEIQYEAYADLGPAVEEQLAKHEERFKKVDEESRLLRRQIAKMKEFLGGKQRKDRKVAPHHAKSELTAA
jgi:hypothetical protein